MTKSLRRRHVQIWSVLLVILPAGIISGRLVTQKQPVNSVLQPAAANALPIIVLAKQKENYTVTVSKSNDSTFQLEWINKTVLTYPTATIYMVDKTNTGIKNGKLIGRIEARGTYRFSLANQLINFSNSKLVLYDFIHQQVIDTINF